MSGPAWFTPYTTETHSIKFPGTDAVAEKMRRDGRSQAEVDAFVAEHTCEVEVRGLNAGDRALLDEMRFTDQGEGRISFGEAKIRTVELSLVRWSLDQPVSASAIRQLQPLMLDEIFAVVPEGRLLVGESEGANGSGPPPAAEMPQPEPAKDAALTE